MLPRICCWELDARAFHWLRVAASGGTHAWALKEELHSSSCRIRCAAAVQRPPIRRLFTRETRHWCGISALPGRHLGSPVRVSPWVMRLVVPDSSGLRPGSSQCPECALAAGFGSVFGDTADMEISKFPTCAVDLDPTPAGVLSAKILHFAQLFSFGDRRQVPVVLSARLSHS